MAKKKPPLGSGARFKAVEASAAASGADNPAAVAAAVGRKKYGNAKMQKMAQAGKKRKKQKAAKGAYKSDMPRDRSDRTY